MDWNRILTSTEFWTGVGGLLTALLALRANIPGFTRQCEPKDKP